jgi:DNA-binding transcriptional regulator YiaG
MSPAAVKEARARLGLTQSKLAALLRMGVNGERQIRRWEDGEVPISGPASVAIEALLTGWRPRRGPVAAPRKPLGTRGSTV